MGKDSRLSLRISKTLDERITKAIEQSDGQIRDRSEFGTKAVKFYLDYIENTKSEDELILDAILALAKRTGIHGEEFTHIEKQISNFHVPKQPVSKKVPQDHPEFNKILALIEKYNEIDDHKAIKRIQQAVDDAAFEDVPGIYQKFVDEFFLNSPNGMK